MARIARLVIAVAAAALAVPALAHAEERSLTFTTPAISVEGYGVAQQPMFAQSPTVDGYVVGMEAEVVDAAGRVQGRDKVMLHHIVFAKIGVPDYTCGGFTERFFAEGEERLALSLPRGYGYANRGTDRWGLLYMLMNHKPQRLNGFIRYTVRYVTGETLTPVKPIWLDVRNCTGPDPVFDVPGGGKQFSTFTKTADFTMPESGRLVSGGGHLHGGGHRLELRNASCGDRELFTSRPTWGSQHPQPTMHEPGPTRMTSWADAAGIPVAAGERLRLRAVYDNSRPHMRVMGIMVAFFAPGPAAACQEPPVLADPLFDPGPPPRVVQPLLREPRGRVARVRETWVADHRFGHERVALRRNTLFRWRFVGPARHDATLANGPEGLASPSVARGVFTFRFRRPGIYNLYCSLHPTRMTQRVIVR